MKIQLIKGLIGLALVGLSTLSFSADHQPTATHNISKELVKQTTTSGVTTFDWVIKYENLSGGVLTDVEIKDTFSSNQSYVPSSEQHPNGWSVSQSGNTIQWNAGFVGAGGYSRPFSSIPSGGTLNTVGGGDGWAPIPYKGAKYVINHHQSYNFPSFKCFGNCTGVWPKMLPDGDPNSSDTSSTSNSPETEIIGGKLFYASTRNSDSGAGCYDLDSQTECGYLQLSSLGYSSASFSGNSSQIEGPFKSGSKLYYLDKNMQVYCVDPSNMSACGSFNASSLSSSPSQISGEVVGSNIYFVLSSPNKVFCYDTILNNDCSAWGGAKNVPSLPYGPSSYIYYDTSMVATHICMKSGTQYCYKITDGSSASLVDITPATALGGEFLLGTKTYIPYILNFDGRVFCYDWSIPGACSPSSIVSDTSNPLVNSNYATEIDEFGCAWVYGDTGKMWSFDPDTNTSPCEKSEFSFEDTFDAGANWCATEDPQWSYTQFKINNIRASDFEELIVEFLDTNGIVIKTNDITGALSHSQGLFTAPFTPGDPIHYRIKVKLADGVTEYTTLPVVTIGIDGPPQEFCLSTTVECPNTEPVVNSVIASVSSNDEDPVLGGEGIPDVSDEVIVDAESSCAPPEPKSCLVIEPKLECITGKGWHVSFTNSTPNYNPTDLDITSLTSGVTVVGNSPLWTLNGATPNSTVKLSANGVMKNGGSEKGTDLCCSTEVEIEIPDEECEVVIENPEKACITANYEGPFYDKAKEQWAFNLGLTSLNGSTINEVKVTPVTSGVTLTNGPIYPVGTPSLSFTGATAGQTAEFKFCAYNKNEMTENETFDCCKVNVKVEIRGGDFSEGFPKKKEVGK